MLFIGLRLGSIGPHTWLVVYFRYKLNVNGLKKHLCHAMTPTKIREWFTEFVVRFMSRFWVHYVLGKAGGDTSDHKKKYTYKHVVTHTHTHTHTHTQYDV